jgi:hypothetical protein
VQDRQATLTKVELVAIQYFLLLHQTAVAVVALRVIHQAQTAVQAAVLDLTAQARLVQEYQDKEMTAAYQVLHHAAQAQAAVLGL